MEKEHAKAIAQSKLQIETLTKQNKELSEAVKRKTEDMQDQFNCTICFEKKIDVCFQTCGHACACETCVDELKNKAKPKKYKCPMCQTVVKKTCTIYL